MTVQNDRVYMIGVDIQLAPNVSEIWLDNNAPLQITVFLRNGKTAAEEGVFFELPPYNNRDLLRSVWPVRAHTSIPAAELDLMLGGARGVVHDDLYVSYAEMRNIRVLGVRGNTPYSVIQDSYRVVNGKDGVLWYGRSEH